MSAVTLVDYGLGNIRAFYNIYDSLGIAVSVARSALEISSAKRLLLPGVGSFDHAMRQLSRSGMRECIDEAVVGRGLPILGVCVGMQIMVGSSEEGVEPGLSWIPGRVRRFEQRQGSDALPLPHMGWNDVVADVGHPLFAGIEKPRFYFLHSYHVSTETPEYTIGSSDYGSRFSSVIARDNIAGVQFHPEKSHAWGIRLLKNFSEI